MQAVRARRVRPHLDDKVLASWNGLMLAALARGYAVLGDADLLEAARRNHDFLRDRLWDAGEKAMCHRWRAGERDRVQLAAGYAFPILGVLELYEVALEPDYLEFAVTLAESLLERFFDDDQGGFWQSPAGGGDLIIRLKEDYDGAEPSANSIAVQVLLRLGRITGRRSFTAAAERTLQFFGDRLQSQPQALPCLLQALDFYLDEPRRVVVTGEVAAVETRQILKTVHSVFQPNKVVLGVRGPVDAFAASLPVSPSLAHVCTGGACQAPTADPETIRRLVSDPVQM